MEPAELFTRARQVLPGAVHSGSVVQGVPPRKRLPLLVITHWTSAAGVVAVAANGSHSWGGPTGPSLPVGVLQCSPAAFAAS